MKQKLFLILAFLLLVPVLALRCSCDVVNPNGETLGICLDSTWTNTQGESIYHCCGQDLDYQGTDLTRFGFVQCTAAAKITGSSNVGTSTFDAASVVTGAQLNTCSSRNGEVCEINPGNGYTLGGADTGYCDDEANTCVECDSNNVETGRWAGGTTFTSGDGLCEDACGATPACDEKSVGDFADPDLDGTIDSCSSDCLTYTDTDTCEYDYNASTECDGQNIGYYNSTLGGGCNNTCGWEGCGNYGWDSTNNRCRQMCDYESDCYPPAVCTPAHTCVVDSNSPIITISSPEQDQIYSSSSINLIYTPTDSVDPEVDCEYALDSDPPVSTGKVTSGAQDIVSITVGEGLHSIYVNCTDQASNEGQSNSIQFTIDFGVPYYNNTYRNPGGQIFHSDDTILYSNWYDASGIGIVYARHNATGGWENYTTQQAGDTYSYTIPASLLDNSETVYWSFWARDAVGNWQSNMTEYSFTVGNRAPATPTLIDQPNTHSTTVVLDWNESTDADSDLIAYNIRVGINTDDDFLNRTESSTSTVLTGLSYYTRYTWAVRACDPYTDCSNWTIADEFNITNNLPTIGDVKTIPTPPSFAYTTDTMFCNVSNVADTDSDQVTFTYDWYKEGVPLSVQTNYLDSSYFLKGDRVSCGAIQLQLTYLSIILLGAAVQLYLVIILEANHLT
jgi:hypothetical protein